jgi:hypothetical protein
VAPDESYDWEVSDALSQWAATQAESFVVGVAVGERQRYRGVALVFTATMPPKAPAMPGREVGIVSGRLRMLT